MSTYVIYGDLLFIMNFLMDFTLLYAVARFGNFRAGFLSLVGASAIGALYGLGAVYPDLQVLNGVFCKTLASLGMVKVAFWHCRGKKYLRAVVYFYLLSFVMAGAAVGITWFFNSGVQWTPIMSYTAMALGFGVLLALALSRWGISYVKGNLRRNEAGEDIEICLGSKAVKVNALLDTGNELLDPVTKSPVAVVEFEAVKPLLPLDFADAFVLKGAGDLTGIMEDFIDAPIGKRLRLIPFSSIGKRNGMLVGIRPDCLRLPMRKGVVVENAVVCLYRGTLHTRDSCRCIVNPAILDGI